MNQYLPIVESNSIWRQSRNTGDQDPIQGWKLHISATILSACSVFERVAPYLTRLELVFKAPSSILELKKLNCGLYYGYSQIGKFITVYPRTEEEAVLIANELHKMTKEFAGPLVPSDNSLRKGSLVHYRYGAFVKLEVDDENGNSVPAVYTPQGNLVQDLRIPGEAVPNWVTDPFTKESYHEDTKSNLEKLSPIINTLAYEAISQRGKSGVYRALDLSTSPARICILKEGRKYGETDWDNRDGYWRVRHEAKVLMYLQTKGINVPKVYTTFEEESNYYLTMELIEGDNLQKLLLRKIAIKDALKYGIQIAKIMKDIHDTGWIWRDCKPLNLILSKEGILRPIDFEGACLIDSPDSMEWGTQGYLPPEWTQPFIGQSRLPEDLYALGATLHQVFSGQIPRTSLLPPIGKLRKRVPSTVRQIIAALLDPNPNSRPSANTVLQVLESSYYNNFGNVEESYNHYLG
ncbi:protein kinase domain-containing protein [Bacillus thuringiensis]|uniref:class III lanthionine synthetase LanKC N-terminal domain-containing protein n=1 Tax=Bacillus thuringiensis TaxID=1428 RepID=UPI0021D67401|nr:protein kinase [Bacillus thuringiensis]MCU7679191.1 protein kinase [Bacillus thuringiensis]